MLAAPCARGAACVYALAEVPVPADEPRVPGLGGLVSGPGRVVEVLQSVFSSLRTQVCLGCLRRA